MQILLDTNFVLTCVKQKIDFVNLINEIIDEKIEWIIPDEVITELKDLSTRKNLKGKDKDSAKLSIELINMIHPEIISIKHKNVDQGIVDYIKDKNIILATLDKELKKKVKNRVMVIKDFKGVEII